MAATCPSFRPIRRRVLIAHVLAEQVIRQCDFLIDLHSARQHNMPYCADAYAGDVHWAAAPPPPSAPVYWAHPGSAWSLAFCRHVAGILPVRRVAAGRVRRPITIATAWRASWLTWARCPG
jgi:hypothetical protein